MNSNEIRQAFLKFFENKSHTIVESAPMVIKNDPTLMFTNAGMNQFKDIFLGNSTSKSNRIADTQKCLRVSGKHNDLEEVGHDTYHHTMFEMLGNWSFGDYFKKEAISWAWEFLVDELKIDSDRLYATVFEGYKGDNLDKDNEAFNIWRKFLPEERILNGSKKDNFWEMGDSGPCGPCSEIHIDIRNEEDRKKIGGAELVNKDHPLVIEIWNLVFIQFNRKANGSLEALPDQHVDTGMGFERLCMVIQKVQSNYDTDVFQPIIKKISNLTGLEYGANTENDIAMRVISDHLRAISFSIADGQLPSNNKAGYVIRRILRRAVRYGFTFLNQKEAFMHKLIPVLIENMGDAFPELKSQKDLITKVIWEEENSFLRTLDTGIKLLDQIILKARDNKQKIISGKEAFELYDTFGFPLDLTELILKENKLSVNNSEFKEEMEKQKTRSRSAATVETDDWIVLKDDKNTEFVGYDYLETEITLIKYRKITTKNKEQFQLVFNRTPFYAESGGQSGDSGYIENNEEKISIVDTKKENNLIVHIAKNLPKNLNTSFKAFVSKGNRTNIMNNHSATHLLHHALRNVLGTHVEQKGSLVHPDYLRFDFSHFQKVSPEDIKTIEKLVNAEIRKNLFLEENRNVPIEEAKKTGAMMLFGEKYDDEVRTIKFGDSIELCGGTHVQATGQIGFFKIVSEGSIASGIRRIEAVTGEKAEKMIFETFDIMDELKAMLENPKNLKVAVENQLNINAELTKKLNVFIKDQGKNLKEEIKNSSKEINGINFISYLSDKFDSTNTIKDIAFQLKGEIENLFLVIGAEIENKPSISIMISDNLIKEKGFHAGNMVREAAKHIKGGGGGQAFFASAGGKDPKGLKDALKEIEDKI